MLQRAPHRDRALESEIEVLRRIAAEADGPILDQSVGMNEPVLETEPVDERLEGRAGRADRRGHVDLPRTTGVEVVGGGDAGEHLPAAMIGGNDSDGDV